MVPLPLARCWSSCVTHSWINVTHSPLRFYTQQKAEENSSHVQEVPRSLKSWAPLLYQYCPRNVRGLVDTVSEALSTQHPRHNSKAQLRSNSQGNSQGTLTLKIKISISTLLTKHRHNFNIHNRSLLTQQLVNKIQASYMQSDAALLRSCKGAR